MGTCPDRVVMGADGRARTARLCQRGGGRCRARRVRSGRPRGEAGARVSAHWRLHPRSWRLGRYKIGAKDRSGFCGHGKRPMQGERDKAVGMRTKCDMCVSTSSNWVRFWIVEEPNAESQECVRARYAPSVRCVSVFLLLSSTVRTSFILATPSSA
jgi:hypothetical protein